MLIRLFSIKTILILSSFLFALASVVRADATVRFIEGAPKDRFEISSDSECLNGPLTVSIDLKDSAGGLIFDTASKGAGVEVFHPFELTAGTALVNQAPAVMDGDTALSLRLSELPKGQIVAFTLDVDDTCGAREITVTGAEIAGARVKVNSVEGSQSAVFDATARVRVDVSSCNA
jgi:hypothetical protein